MKSLIKGASAIYLARGGDKEILPEEKPTIDFAYASVVSIAPIKAGERLTEKNIWVKRPGSGEIRAIDFEKCLGKSVSRNIDANSFISWADFN